MEQPNYEESGGGENTHERMDQVNGEQFAKAVEREILNQRKDKKMKHWMLVIGIGAAVLLTLLVGVELAMADGTCIVINGRRYCWGW